MKHVMKKKKKAPATRKKLSRAKSSRASSFSASLEINGDRWPMERDVFFRPDRLKYVRRLIPEDGCVFCLAAKERPSFETLCVYQTEHSMIVLNKYPYNSGHLLVLPRRHTSDLLELSDKEYVDLQECLRLSVQTLKEVYNPGGLNLGLNLGAVAGAGIPGHIHYHVIPRWAGDLNFFPLVAETKTVIENLETTFERLIAYLGQLPAKSTQLSGKASRSNS